MDRFDWRVGAKQHEGAQTLLLESSTSAEALRVPARWASMRVDYTRLAMRNGDWDRALRLATPHFLTPDNRHYADLEWLAGFAALKTGDAARALTHFDHLETVASRRDRQVALFSTGRPRDAAFLGRRCRRPPGLWCGGRPARHLLRPVGDGEGRPPPARRLRRGRRGPSTPCLTGAQRCCARVRSFAQACRLVARTGATTRMRSAAICGKPRPPTTSPASSRLMYEARPGPLARPGCWPRRSANQGVIWPVAHFPLTGLEREDLGPPPELVVAIARPESEFNQRPPAPSARRGDAGDARHRRNRSPPDRHAL